MSASQFRELRVSKILTALLNRQPGIRVPNTKEIAEMVYEAIKEDLIPEGPWEIQYGVFCLAVHLDPTLDSNRITQLSTTFSRPIAEQVRHRWMQKGVDSADIKWRMFYRFPEGHQFDIFYDSWKHISELPG